MRRTPDHMQYSDGLFVIEVFVMHELEGKSFKEIAAETGELINTLLSRKRYAVLALRERLAA